MLTYAGPLRFSEMIRFNMLIASSRTSFSLRNMGCLYSFTKFCTGEERKLEWSNSGNSKVKQHVQRPTFNPKIQRWEDCYDISVER